MKFLKITGGIVLLLIVLFFILTDTPDQTPFYNAGYFKDTSARLDSLKKGIKASEGTFSAGFAKISITPGLNSAEDNAFEGRFTKVPLAGYGSRKGKPANGIHDSVFVKAVALQGNDNLLVFVTAGLLIMPPNVIDSVTLILSGEGISRDRLFFSATHSHSGPGGWGPGFIASQFAGEFNPSIEKWLIHQIVTAVKTAIADLKPARLGTGSFSAGEHTRNRLVGNLGTTNDDFNFIVVEQLNHQRAVIGSFAAHSTTLGAGNMEVSGDYPGFWERKTEQAIGGMALFFAGSMGSQSPTGKGEAFDRSRQIGESLADSLIKYYPQILMKDSLYLSSLSLKVDLPGYRMRITQKIGLSENISSRLMPYPGNVYLQAARIGNLVWITTPADFSGEYALEIKNSLAAHGYDSMVTGFNGNYVGYIIPGRYFYLDEYEPKTMGWFGPTMGDYTMHLIRNIYMATINKEF
jgi:neutral ceramidase